MKRKRLAAILLLIMILLSSAACSGGGTTESATPSASASPSPPPSVVTELVQAVDTSAVAWFSGLFPDKTESTWHYDAGVGEDWLVLAAVERDADRKTSRFIFEGESVSRGTREHPAYEYAAYEVTEEGVFLVVADERLPLLASGLVEGAAWSGRWLDPDNGIFDASFTLAKVSGNSVTVHIEADESRSGLKMVDWESDIVLEQGSGIRSESVRITSDGSTLERTRTLAKISSIAPPVYASRHVSPTRLISPFVGSADNDISLLTTVRDWIRNNPDAKPSEKVRRLEELFEPLQSASGSDNAGIPVAAARRAALLMIGSASGAEADPVILWFADYHARCMENRSDLADTLNGSDGRLIDLIFTWNQANWRMESIAPARIMDPEARTIASILLDNGVQLSWSEGWPYFIEKPGYSLDTFGPYASGVVRGWLELKNWELANHPLADDGGLVVERSLLVSHMVALESFADAWPDTEQGKWAKESAHSLLEWLVVPTDWFPNTPLYMDGRIQDDILASYDSAIASYPESESVAVIRVVRDLLKESGGTFTPALYDYLVSQGYSSFSQEIVDEMKLASARLEDLKAMAGFEAAPLTEQQSRAVPLTVDNVEALLRAIGSDRYIQLRPGDYVLPDSWSGEHVRIENGECIVSGVSNLMIVGQGDTPPTIRGTSTGYVMRFDAASDVRLENISFGHVLRFCQGGVIGLRDSQRITMDGCILFGCGFWGLDAVNVDDLKIYRSVLSDCQTTALELYNARYVDISSCVLARNGRNVALFDGSAHIRLNGLRIRDNNGESDVSALFRLNECTDVVAKGLEIGKNATDTLQSVTGEPMKSE